MHPSNALKIFQDHLQKTMLALPSNNSTGQLVSSPLQNETGVLLVLSKDILKEIEAIWCAKMTKY